MDEREFLLWATPSASDSVGSHGGGQGRSLRTDISNLKKGIWPTPQARDYRSADDPSSPRVARKAEQGWSTNLNDAVKLWPTPRANKVGGKSSEGWSPTLEQSVKMWPTPRANDAEKRGNIDPQDPRNGLPAAVKLWPTPQASDNRDRGNLSNPAIRKRIESGKQVNLSMCVSENSGQLNPDWVECLMGFPIGWTDIDRDETESHWIEEPRWPAGPNEEQYEWEPPRVATGVKNRVPRLKACGNAVVPAHAYPFMAAIKAVHEGNLT